ELSSRAADFDVHYDQRETAAVWQGASAFRDVLVGNRDEARQQAAAALKLASTHDSQILAALVYARAGDSVGAEKLADELAKKYPGDPLVNNYWLPAIRASLELERKDPAKAAGLLKPVLQYDFATPSSPAVCVGAPSIPVYLRGEAYLQIRDGAAAGAEFQKLIDHKPLIGNFVVGSLAHLGLGRAAALSGDLAKARVAYQDFFALWKDADPNIPILKQAKAEYAKLQ